MAKVVNFDELGIGGFKTRIGSDRPLMQMTKVTVDEERATRLLRHLTNLNAIGLFPEVAHDGTAVDNDGKYTLLRVVVRDANGDEQFRHIGMRLSEKKSLERISPQDITDVRIVLGPSLFGAYGAIAVSEGGSTESLVYHQSANIRDSVSDLDISDGLSFYEWNSILGLGKLVGEINKATLAKSMAEAGNAVNIMLDYVRDRYYLYILAPYNNGAISSEQAAKWFDHVDLRAELVKDAIGTVIGVNGQQSLMTMEPLQPALAYIQDSIKSHQKVDAVEIIRLLKEADPLWKAIVEAKHKPDEQFSFEDIAYMSYVHTYLTAARGNPSNTMMLAVEDAMEYQIFANTLRVLKEMRLAGLDMDFSSVNVLYAHHNTVEVAGHEQGEPVITKGYIVSSPPTQADIAAMAQSYGVSEQIVSQILALEKAYGEESRKIDIGQVART